ncbi:MAG TPA: GNAT family N-acetyltransferase [Caulobacteraceae bacterium]
MNIDVKNNKKAGRFEVELDGETAFAEYDLKRDGSIVFPHTVVPGAFEGRGVGSALAKAALGYARDEGLKVIPLCSFFAGYIARHPEYLEIVNPRFRDRVKPYEEGGAKG